MRREEAKGRLLLSLLEGGIKWLPKTDEDWDAAIHLYLADSKPQLAPGRPSGMDFDWTNLLMGWAICTGHATTNGKISVNKAGEIAADRIDKLIPPEGRQTFTAATLVKRWNNKRNELLDIHKRYANNLKLDHIRIDYQNRCGFLIMEWEMKHARDFWTLRKKFIATELS